MVRRYEPEDQKSSRIRPVYWFSVLVIVLIWVFAFKMYFNRYEYMHPDVTWATPGLDKQTERADGVLLWDENVLYAPMSGKVSYPQGTGPVRVIRGAVVAKVSNGASARDIKAQQQGYFIAGTDGHENKWRYSYIWPGSDPFPAAGRVIMAHNGQAVSADHAVGKLIPLPQDLRFVGYAKKSGGVADQLRKKRLRVMMDIDDSVSTAPISISNEFNNKIKFLMTMPWFNDEDILSRKYSLIIETSETEGAMIPQKSVGTKDGTQGVYLVRGSRVIFRPIEGAPVRNGKFLVTKGIFIGDTVVEDASNAKEGRIQLW
jgi:hypothetical protein